MIVCLYRFGLGAPEDYLAMRIDLHTEMELSRQQLLRDLVAMHYQRNDVDFHRGLHFSGAGRSGQNFSRV